LFAQEKRQQKREEQQWQKEKISSLSEVTAYLIQETNFHNFFLQIFLQHLYFSYFLEATTFSCGPKAQDRADIMGRTAR
jgi:hypothetical protein